MQTRLGVTEDAARAWIPIFAASDFVWGIVLVFAYAAILPRFGPGPRTAVISGIMLWLVIVIFAVVLLALGLHTPQSFVKSSAFYLISALVSSVVGGALYKE
jgi:hypothetical protein